MYKDDISRKSEEISGELFIGQDIDNFEFEKCIIKSCDFSASSIKDFRIYSSKFNDSKLSGVFCSEAFLKQVTFNSCKCDNINFRFSKFKDVVFESCNLQGADFQNSDLKGVSFLNCDLRGATLAGANLIDTDISTSIAEGIIINLVDFKGLIVNSVQALNFSNYLGIIIKD